MLQWGRHWSRPSSHRLEDISCNNLFIGRCYVHTDSVIHNYMLYSHCICNSLYYKYIWIYMLYDCIAHPGQPGQVNEVINMQSSPSNPYILHQTMASYSLIFSSVFLLLNTPSGICWPSASSMVRQGARDGRPSTGPPSDALRSLCKNAIRSALPLV